MEKIESILKSKSKPQMDIYSMFLFVEDIFKLKNIPSDIELCVIKMTFTEQEIQVLASLVQAYPLIEFWICTEELSKQNISIANKLHIKTVVEYPFCNELIEKYFITKYGSNPMNEASVQDYSCVSGMNVMIVDDNKMNIELLEEILSKLDLNISSFTKAQDAYNALYERKIDLFLLDIMMPEMSGYDLAEKIKSTFEYKNAQLIFISALSDSNTKIKSYSLGSCAHIEKPFDVDILRTQIFNILKNLRATEMVSSNKENFLATVAHDLKTPIRAGINALNLLLNKKLGSLDETQHEIVEDLLSSTKYMQDMVENILSKNRIENDTITLSKEVYPLKELISHCIEITKYITEQKQQKINFKSHIKNTLIPFDFTEMKRAVHNLIANASEYSSVGGKINIEIFKSGKNIGVSVQDFGRGIELENQDEIFVKYMTLAKKNKTVGSGLGLYITKRIIEAHNGEIKLESKVGFGTKITLMLPMYEKQ